MDDDLECPPPEYDSTQEMVYDVVKGNIHLPHWLDFDDLPKSIQDLWTAAFYATDGWFKED